MGHVRLGVLPTWRKWRQVVEELRLGAKADTVAAAIADADEAALDGASRDPAFLYSLWLLTQGSRIRDYSPIHKPALKKPAPPKPRFFRLMSKQAEAISARDRSEWV